MTQLDSDFCHEHTLKVYNVKSKPMPEPVPAFKKNKGKPRLSLVPSALIYGAARAYTWAAGTKYPAFNYRNPPGLPTTDLADSVLRHMEEFKNRQLLDPESGLEVLDHAAAALGMLMDTIERIKLGILPRSTDDRYVGPTSDDAE